MPNFMDLKRLGKWSETCSLGGAAGTLYCFVAIVVSCDISVGGRMRCVWWVVAVHSYGLEVSVAQLYTLP